MELKLKHGTQNWKIYNWLKNHGEINSKDAAYTLGILKLPQRIFELRALGANIRTETDPKTHYPKYVLVREEQE